MATAALHVRDPHEPGSWGLCPWRTLTGLWCPGCGGLRAVNDLTRLDVAGAASSNLLLLLVLPVAVVLWLRWVQRSWRGTEPPGRGAATVPVTTYAAVALAASAAVAFGVLRNLPGSWLAP